MQNTGKRCVILLVFIILRWSFNYESNVFRYNKILKDCEFGNSKFVVPSTLTIDLGFASVNSQCLWDNKLAIPSYPVNKYILLHTLEHSIRLTMNFSGNKQSFLPSSQPCVIYILLPGAIVVMIVLLLDLQSPVQSVPITTKVVSSNHAHGEVYSIQHLW